jgi:sugar phosphate isomerase/epimerase
MMKEFSRRTFVRKSALAAAASVAMPRFASAGVQPINLGHPSPIRLGLASYTFRNFTRAQMIGFMRELGINQLNAKDVKDHLPMDPAGEAAALADYKAAGIEVHAAGVVSFTKDDDDDIRAKFEYAKRAGLKVLVAGDPAPTTLPRIEKFVREYDIRFAIHNHGPEDKIWPGPIQVYQAVKEMDPRMGCCIDVGHAARAGTDIPAAIRTIGARVFNVHMKDLTNFSEKESQVAVGEGYLPIADIFLALAYNRYPGWVDLEYEIKPEDPLPGVAESYTFMRGVIAGMGYNWHETKLP